MALCRSENGASSGRRSASAIAGWLWVGFLAFGITIPTLAGRAPQGPGLLSPEQGQVVLSVAREHRENVRRKPDCSHLVHEVYRRAGYDYPYATSFGLYAGVRSFARVENPQPGDLIVWRGHVGIVIDPGKQTFYSSLSSGLSLDSYGSRYWRGRGPAHFYRFVPEASGRILIASGPPQRPKRAPGRTTTPGLTPGSPAASPTLEIPSSIHIVTSSSKPTREEVAEALSELSNAAVDLLRGDDLAALRHPVIIYDQLHVRSVKVKGKKGKAQIQIDSRVTIDGKKIKQKRRSQKQRWELRRDSSGWHALRPQNRIYVPREVAVHVLAEKLELLTRADYPVKDRTRHADQQAQLAHLLYALLGKK